MEHSMPLVHGRFRPRDLRSKQEIDPKETEQADEENRHSVKTDQEN